MKEDKNTVNIAVLVSGSGTNLQAIIDAEKNGKIESGKISLVISSKPGVYALTRAESAGIKTAVVDISEYPDRGKYSDAVARCLEKESIGLVVFAGFMYILTPQFCKRYENRMINVHPALIPSFCGRGYYGLRVHRAALDAGAKVTGATVHFVNEITDGGPIILQKAVAIEEEDTPQTLQQRVMHEAEWEILPHAVSLFCQGRLIVEGQTVKIKPATNEISRGQTR